MWYLQRESKENYYEFVTNDIQNSHNIIGKLLHTESRFYYRKNQH